MDAAAADGPSVALASANPGGPSSGSATVAPFGSLDGEGVLTSVVALLPADDLQARIDQHKAERSANMKQKKEVTHRFRNEKKKRARLIKKSAGLKITDLLAILHTRQEQKTKKASREAVG